MALPPSPIYLTIAGVLSCLIAIPPLIIQVQQRNTTFCTLIVALITLNTACIVKAWIWHSEDIDSWWDGRIFCDIETRLTMILGMAVLGSVICIFRQLSLVFHPSSCPISKSQERVGKAIEIIFCFIHPVLWTATVLLVQPDRYWILFSHGCTWTVDRSWLGYFIAAIWPLIISVIGLIYGILTAYRIFQYRRGSNGILGQQQLQRNSSRTNKVSIYGLVLFVIIIPYQIYAIYNNTFTLYNVPDMLEPYSWRRIHPADWSRRIFKISQPANTFRFILLDSLDVFYSLIVLTMLGFTPDAMDTYKVWLARFRACRVFSGNGRLTTTRSSRTDIPNMDGMAVPRQVTGRHELEAFSINRQDQEAL